MNIYSRYRNRAVNTPADMSEEVLNSIRRLSAKCRENVLMLDEELASNDPDPGERCGLLDNRFEVYALTIPQCSTVRLALSIDFGDGEPPSIMLHGAVPERKACETAQRLAIRHRRLQNPVWE